MASTGGQSDANVPDVIAVEGDDVETFHNHERISEDVVDSVIKLVWKTREIARDNLLGWSQGRYPNLPLRVLLDCRVSKG